MCRQIKSTVHGLNGTVVDLNRALVNVIEAMNILPSSPETGVNFAELKLPLCHLSDVNVIIDLILCFWGHVLYIRNQIPLPLKNFTEGALKIDAAKLKSKSNRVKKLSDFDLRYQNLSKSLNSLLADLDQNGKLQEIISVCVMIGPSASSTLREAYYLDFDNGYKSLEDVRVSSSQNQRDQSKRQLVRTMISNWDSDMTSSPITNSFVAIHFQGSASTALEIQQSLLVSGEISDFNMKEDFNIKVRKKSPPCFRLCVSPSDYSNLSGAERSAEGDDSANPVVADFWLVLRKGIKGVKSLG
jgi:hypothetical protein